MDGLCHNSIEFWESDNEELGTKKNTVDRARVALTLFLFGAAMLCGSHALAQAAGATAESATVPDHAGSYYHFMLARRYEELAGIYNRPEYVQRSVSEFKKAIADDPDSLFLHSQLGDLYWRAGQDSDAITEAQLVLKKNPNDLDAHRLLGHVYVQELGRTSLQASVAGNLQRAVHEYETIVQLDPSDTHSEILLGRLYELNRQPKQAAQMFQKVLAANPNSAEALMYLGNQYLRDQQYSQATQVLERIPDDRKSAQTYVDLGAAYSQMQKFDKAAQNFKAALQMDPVNEDVRRQYADALMRSGKTGPARVELETVLKSNPKDGRALLRLAQLDQAEGHYNQAAQELDQAQKLMPGDLEVAYTDAQLQDALGHEDAAIKTLKQLLAQTASPSGTYSGDEANDRGAFLERLGLIYRSQSSYNEAVSTFRQMAALGGDQASRGDYLIVETLQLQGQFAKAAAEAQIALQKFPKNQSLNLIYASVLGDQGHVDQAVARVRDFMKANGDSVEAQLQIVEVYSQAKRYREAENIAQDLLQQNLKPSQREYTQFLLGSVYERQKKYGQAEGQFKAVLATDPLNAAAYNYLGYMLADRGVQLQQSVDDIKKALQLDPNNGAYLDSLGWAYYKMSRYDQAREPLEKAAHLLANDPTVLMHLGHLYVKLGQKTLAVQTWKQALEHYPSAADTDFDSTQAAKLKKSLNQVEHQLSKTQ
jgi:tetratricopeptide (TPR) repeat protein